MIMFLRKTPLSPVTPPTPPPTPAISLSLTPTSGFTFQGGSVTVGIVVTRTNYTGAIELSITGLPSGVTNIFTPTSIVNPSTSASLQLDVSLATLVSAGNAITITATGTGVTPSVQVYTLDVTVAVSGGRYFRPSTINAELPRGISPAYDVYFDELTQTLLPATPLWGWDVQRVGSARHAAATIRTVTNTGAAGWTDFLTFQAEFVAGSGDWEIRVPTALTLPDSGAFGWKPPNVGGADRILFVTFSGTLPTANVMPSIAAVEACSIWTGPVTNTEDGLILIDNPNLARVTFTGIVLRPQAFAGNFGLITIRNPSATDMSTAPKNFVLDRCIVDGLNAGTMKNGILRNGQQLAFLESWIINIRTGSNETKGMGGYSQSKYIYSRNVYIESLGIGDLYGGADPVLPGTGICDPSDILSVNVVCAKKLSWMTENGGNAALGMKNGFESKNVSRWFILNCITHRNAATGQNGISMIFQNLQEGGDINSAANINQDIVVHNHLFKDCPAGITVHARIRYVPGTLPMNPSARIALDNIFLQNLGTTYGISTGCRPFKLFADNQSVLIDRWTATVVPGNVSYMELGGSGATSIRINNYVGPNPGIFGETPTGNFGQTALSCLNQYSGGSYNWAGNTVYGTAPIGGGTYTPGQTTYANAAAMGFDTATGIISAPGNDDGVGGSVPGVDHTQLNAALLSMQPWAFSR